MGNIFTKPPVETLEATVGDQTLVLHQFTADVFWDHLSTVEGMMAVTPKEAGEELREGESAEPAPETPDADRAAAERMLGAFRKRKDWNLLALACSLAPGYPGVSVDELRAELGLNLSPAQLTDLVNQVNELNGISFPKPDAQTGALSAG